MNCIAFLCKRDEHKSACVYLPVFFFCKYSVGTMNNVKYTGFVKFYPTIHFELREVLLFH